MNVELKKEVQDLIAKSLPALAADELKGFIENAQKESQELKSVKARLAETEADLRSTRIEVDKFRQDTNNVARLKSELDAKQLDLETRERNLKITILEEKLASAQTCNGQLHSLMSTFVANPRAIEQINQHKWYSHETYWTNGQELRRNTGENITGTIERTESK